MRTGRRGTKRNSSGALCAGVGKKSKLSFIHRHLGHPYQLVIYVTRVIRQTSIFRIIALIRCAGVGKKSKLSFIHRQLGYPYQLVI
jgi:hypothetical protein